jgi:hypothetical protein
LTYEARTMAGSVHDQAKLAKILAGEWMHSPVYDVPRQQDGVNCGVFAMVFADCLSAGFPVRDCPLYGAALRESRAHIAEVLLQVRACWLRSMLSDVARAPVACPAQAYCSAIYCIIPCEHSGQNMYGLITCVLLAGWPGTVCGHVRRCFCHTAAGCRCSKDLSPSWSCMMWLCVW